MQTKNVITTETVGNPQKDCMDDIIRKTNQATGKVVFLGTRREFMETAGSDLYTDLLLDKLGN